MYIIQDFKFKNLFWFNGNQCQILTGRWRRVTTSWETL